MKIILDLSGTPRYVALVGIRKGVGWGGGGETEVFYNPKKKIIKRL